MGEKVYYYPDYWVRYGYQSPWDSMVDGYTLRFNFRCFVRIKSGGLWYDIYCDRTYRYDFNSSDELTMKMLEKMEISTKEFLKMCQLVKYNHIVTPTEELSNFKFSKSGLSPYQMDELEFFAMMNNPVLENKDSISMHYLSEMTAFALQQKIDIAKIDSKSQVKSDDLSWWQLMGWREEPNLTEEQIKKYFRENLKLLHSKKDSSQYNNLLSGYRKWENKLKTDNYGTEKSEYKREVE